MGGIRASRAARVAFVVGVTTLGVGTIVSCDNDTGTGTAPTSVDSASAFTALVEWQASEQEPVVNDDGEAALPVIYVVAADGETIDVGVQAAVAEATVDIATVRFADEATEAFELDDDAVRDDGSMLLVGAMPAAAGTITVDLVRYLAADRPEPFQLQITADDVGTTSVSGASVTAVSQP